MPPLPSKQNPPRQKLPPGSVYKGFGERITSTAPISLWEERDIEIDTKDGWTTIHAKVYGQIAVHRGSAFHTDKWVITSLTTGLSACWTTTEGDARKIGEILSTRFCMVFREKSKEVIVEKFPAWAKAWLVACRNEGRYLPPDGFKNACL